jgi:hypothetical protein
LDGEEEFGFEVGGCGSWVRQKILLKLSQKNRVKRN